MKVVPSILAPLRNLLRAASPHARPGRPNARPPYSGRDGPAPAADGRVALPGHQCVWRALQAARVLEDPDSSEEDQQAAREAMHDALRRLLAAG